MTVTRPAASATVHPPCSSRHLGLDGKLEAIARALADEVTVPVTTTCCGFAGDRGLLHPELTAAATRDEAGQLEDRHFDAHLCSNRTCEIGLQQATGGAYTSFMYLLEQATRSSPATLPQLTPRVAAAARRRRAGRPATGATASGAARRRGSASPRRRGTPPCSAGTPQGRRGRPRPTPSRRSRGTVVDWGATPSGPCRKGSSRPGPLASLISQFPRAEENATLDASFCYNYASTKFAEFAGAPASAKRGNQLAASHLWRGSGPIGRRSGRRATRSARARQLTS